MLKKDLIHEMIDTDTLVLIDRNNDNDDQPTIDYNTKSNKNTDDQFNLTNDATDSRYIYSLAYFKSAPRDMYESIEKYTESLVEKLMDKNDISDESKDILSRIKSDVVKNKIIKLLNTVKYHDFGDIDKFNIILFIIKHIKIPNSEEIIELIKKETNFKEEKENYKRKINEENSRLANKSFSISDSIIKRIETNLERLTPEHSGYEFLNNLLKDKEISYENIKRKIHNFKNDDQFSKNIDKEIINYLEKLLKFLRQNSKNLKDVKDKLRSTFGIEKISKKDIEISESTKKRKKKPKANPITGYFPVRGLHYLHQDHDEEGDAGNFTGDVALGIDGGGDGGGGMGESEEKIDNQIDENLEDYMPQHSLDIEEFKKLRSFKKRVDMLRYANFVKRISSGSGRIAYDIGNNKVLKLAYNRKGIAQNEAECDNYKSAKSINSDSILAEIYDCEPDNKWVIMEKINKLTITQFRDKTGIQSLNDLSNYLIMEVNFRNRETLPVKEYIKNNEFALEVRDFLQNLNIIESLGDYYRLNSYGINSKGDVVLVDYGITDSVGEEHYGHRKRRNIYEDQISGGLADKKNIKDFDKEELLKGAKVEMEHTTDPKIALEIAMDHLTEDPNYYIKLLKLEL